MIMIDIIHIWRSTVEMKKVEGNRAARLKSSFYPLITRINTRVVFFSYLSPFLRAALKLV
jgi:hypothetical protein